jgi:hypothetical protein
MKPVARLAASHAYTHPGSEVFYVLAGAQTTRIPHGAMSAKVGESETGHDAETPM